MKLCVTSVKQRTNHHFGSNPHPLWTHTSAGTTCLLWPRLPAWLTDWMTVHQQPDPPPTWSRLHHQASANIPPTQTHGVCESSRRAWWSRPSRYSCHCFFLQVPVLWHLHAITVLAAVTAAAPVTVWAGWSSSGWPQKGCRLASARQHALGNRVRLSNFTTATTQPSMNMGINTHRSWSKHTILWSWRRTLAFLPPAPSLICPNRLPVPGAVGQLWGSLHKEKMLWFFCSYVGVVAGVNPARSFSWFPDKQLVPVPLTPQASSNPLIHLSHQCKFLNKTLTRLIAWRLS